MGNNTAADTVSSLMLHTSYRLPAHQETKKLLKQLPNDYGQANYKPKIALASNPSTSARVLTELVRDKDSYVRSTALRNPKIPVEFLWEYVNSINMQCRSAVVSNPAVPVAILEQVIADTALGTMAGSSKLLAASHPNFRPRRLTELAEHDDPFVRAGVAMNPHTDFSVIVQLLNDYDLTVVSYANDRINLMDEGELQEALMGNGYSELVGLPKAWVAKVLNSTKAAE